MLAGGAGPPNKAGRLPSQPTKVFVDGRANAAQPRGDRLARSCTIRLKLRLVTKPMNKVLHLTLSISATSRDSAGPAAYQLYGMRRS